MTEKADKLLEITMANWGTIIAGTALAGTFLTSTALWGYLSTFDQNLIWVIEYSDVIKFTIIGLAIMLPAFSTLYMIVSCYYAWQRGGFDKIMWVIIAATVVTAVNLGIRYLDRDAAVLAFFILGLLGVLIALSTIENLNPGVLVGCALMVSVAVYAVGALVGHFVLAGDARRTTVLLKEDGKEVLYQDVKVIMILSHHSTFWIGGQSITVPTSDVVRITRKAKP